MGQAKRRGTYNQRVAQALAANAALEAELRDSASPLLKRFMDKNGVQKFRMSVGMHVTQNEQQHKASLQTDDRKESLPTGQELSPTKQVE